jgi:hypothetical protein
MTRVFGLFCLLLPTIGMRAQSDDDYVNDKVMHYDDYIYKPNIRTVQFHQSGWDYGPPVINLYSNEQLEFSFDDLDGDQKRYSVSFVHCNADWTPSDLMTGEYLSGYFDLNILNAAFSSSTYQKYTHYSISFPQGSQNNIQFSKSGNYVMYMYVNGDRSDLVLCRRFMIFDSKANLSAVFHQVLGGGEQFSRQQIDVTVSSPGYEITNPMRDMKLVIMQNSRWDNAILDMKPTFLNGSQFIFSLDDKSSFNGGNEFRYFDVRSLRYATERVKEIYRDEKMQYHITLTPDKSRLTSPYLFYSDINGYFVIQNRETQGNQDLEADYVYVDFFIPYLQPESEGNFYILGKITDWRMNRNSRMMYNYQRMGYEARLYLKQGYYNYIYVLSNDARKSGDEKVMEGSYWDTENEYCVYVYHRKFGTYYDQLIGFKKFNSLKR